MCTSWLRKPHRLRPLEIYCVEGVRAPGTGTSGWRPVRGVVKGLQNKINIMRAMPMQNCKYDIPAVDHNVQGGSKTIADKQIKS
jgi:hypothetical protein